MSTVRILIALGIAVGIVAGSVVALRYGAQTPSAERETGAGTLASTTVTIHGATVRVGLAATMESREKGLSGRPSLASDEGLLFIFDYDDTYGFWMPDMLFPIDIIWLDRNLSVVSIKEHATPESYPEIFRPTDPARFVLEVPDGFVQTHGVKKGDVAVVKVP